MISFDFHNLFSLPSEHGISEKELSDVSDRIPDYLKKIEARDQGFYKIIDEDFKAKIDGEFDQVVILGIGGSALGARCLGEMLGRANGPGLYIIDNVDPILVATVASQLDPEKTLFLVISKSGETIETNALYSFFKEKGKHFLFISDGDVDPKPDFEIPKNVGGRFSVLTAAGLVPAQLLGVDVEALLNGARKMRDSFLCETFEENVPFQLAAVSYLLAEKGKNINVMMPYSQRLVAFTDWWRQLLAESTGKEGKGITPIPALGATDQHSQLQLYNDGPNDKFFLFFDIENPGFDLPTHLNEITFHQLISTEMQGTIQSLTENERPSLTIHVEHLNAETLGALFMLFEASTAFLGEFYGINAFDQPGVERSKKITRKLLNLS